MCFSCIDFFETFCLEHNTKLIWKLYSRKPDRRILGFEMWYYRRMLKVMLIIDKVKNQETLIG